jgi:hypothetical protein
MQAFLNPLAVLQPFVLPLGIAIIGAVTTINVSAAQLRSRDRERDQDRNMRESERERASEESITSVRAEVIEGIAEAFAIYAERSTGSAPESASEFRVNSALLRLTTRCDAEHLSSLCVGYVGDTKQLPEAIYMLETFADIQRRLEGWHLGHMTLDQLVDHLNSGRKDVRAHLRQHGVVPNLDFFERE